MALDITKAKLETSQQKNACKVLKANDRHRTLYTGQQVIQREGRKKLPQAWKAARMLLVKAELPAQTGASPRKGERGMQGDRHCNPDRDTKGSPGLHSNRETDHEQHL